ncbi:MAG: tetratricopeptide repeat protein [Bacteroidota bacterium]
MQLISNNPYYIILKTSAVLLSFVFLLFSCNSNSSGAADSLFEAGRYKEAIEAYTKMIESEPSNSSILYNRGRSYEEIGEIDLATSDFEAVLKLDPKNVKAYLSLAKLSYKTEAFSKALVLANKALELNENNAEGHFFAARASHQLGYLDGALESYNNAITVDKNYGQAYLYRGAVKVGLKKMRSACEDFKLAQTLEVEGASKAVNQYCN